MAQEYVTVDNERIRHLFWMGEGPRPKDAVPGGSGLVVSEAALKGVLGLPDGVRVVRFGLVNDTAFVCDRSMFRVEHPEPLVEADEPITVGG